MIYKIGDIVRINNSNKLLGLFEVTGIEDHGEITVTPNECNSELYVGKKDLIFVCAREDRKDI